MVVDITGDHRVIAEVSFPNALTTLHEKAIYLHEARQFQVERFDYEGRKAYVRRVDSDYSQTRSITRRSKSWKRSNGGRPAPLALPMETCV